MAVVRVERQKIKRVFLKELTQEELDRVVDVKRGPNAGTQAQIYKGKTHKVSFEMEDGVWFQAGSTRILDNKPREWQKCIDDEWLTVNNGALVSFKAKGDPGYNANVVSDSFDVIENGAVNPDPYIYNPSDGGQSSGGGSTPQQPYNNKGALQGNAFNGSMILLKDKFDSPKLIETALALKKINEEIKAQLPSANGASIGMAILTACKAGKKIGAVKDIAITILTTQIPEIEAAWDGEQPATQDNSSTPQTSEPEQEEADSSGLDDSDIPF